MVRIKMSSVRSQDMTITSNWLLGAGGKRPEGLFKQASGKLYSTSMRCVVTRRAER